MVDNITRASTSPLLQSDGLNTSTGKIDKFDSDTQHSFQQRLKNVFDLRSISVLMRSYLSRATFKTPEEENLETTDEKTIGEATTPPLDDTKKHETTPEKSIEESKIATIDRDSDLVTGAISHEADDASQDSDADAEEISHEADDASSASATGPLTPTRPLTPTAPPRSPTTDSERSISVAPPNGGSGGSNISSSEPANFKNQIQVDANETQQDNDIYMRFEDNAIARAGVSLADQIMKEKSLRGDEVEVACLFAAYFLLPGVGLIAGVFYLSRHGAYNQMIPFIENLHINHTTKEYLREWAELGAAFRQIDTLKNNISIESYKSIKRMKSGLDEKSTQKIKLDILESKLFPNGNQNEDQRKCYHKLLADLAYYKDKLTQETFLTSDHEPTQLMIDFCNNSLFNSSEIASLRDQGEDIQDYAKLLAEVLCDNKYLYLSDSPISEDQDPGKTEEAAMRHNVAVFMNDRYKKLQEQGKTFMRKKKVGHLFQFKEKPTEIFLSYLDNNWLGDNRKFRLSGFRELAPLLLEKIKNQVKSQAESQRRILTEQQQYEEAREIVNNRINEFKETLRFFGVDVPTDHISMPSAESADPIQQSRSLEPNDPTSELSDENAGGGRIDPMETMSDYYNGGGGGDGGGS